MRSRVIAGFVDGEEEVVLTRRQDIRVGNCAWCDHTSDLALHQLHTLLRRFHLIANCDLIALPEQAGNITVCGVVRDAAHGDWIFTLLVASCKRNFKLARSCYGIFEEKFVEVA